MCRASRSTAASSASAPSRVEGVAHRHARERILLDAAVDLRHLQPADVEDGRDDVGAVVVLVAHFAAGLDALRPRDHQRVAGASRILGVALEHLERRRRCCRPPGRIVLVGVRPAEPVDQLEVLRELVRIAVEELVLVDRSVRAALSRRAVVGREDDNGVLELPAALQVVDDPADLRIGVLGESGVHLHQAREQLLLVGVECAPGTYHVGGIRHVGRKRVERRERGALRQDALLNHPRQHPLAIRLIAGVELALVLVDVRLRAMMRRVVGAGAEPQVPRPRRVRGVMVAEHAQRFIRQILGEVIALFRAVRLVDELVVVDEIRIPLVGLAAEKAVEAIEALLQGPLLPRRTRGDVLLRHVVILAEPERTPPVVLEDLRHRRALERNASVRAGESVRTLGNRRHAVQVMVASGQERGASRRAQRRRVPLRIAQAAIGQFLERRHVDAAAERRPRGQAGVVVQHEQDVRRALRRLRRQNGSQSATESRTSSLIVPLNAFFGITRSPSDRHVPAWVIPLAEPTDCYL